jgi:hypothetical protein
VGARYVLVLARRAYEKRGSQALDDGEETIYALDAVNMLKFLG